MNLSSITLAPQVVLGGKVIFGLSVSTGGKLLVKVSCNTCNAKKVVSATDHNVSDNRTDILHPPGAAAALDSAGANA